MANIDKIREGQNKTKQAIAASVANDVEHAASQLSKQIKNIESVRSELAANIKGKAADEIEQCLSEIKNEMSNLSRTLNGLSDSINSTARNVYK